jgi:hypothetical protein
MQEVSGSIPLSSTNFFSLHVYYRTAPAVFRIWMMVEAEEYLMRMSVFVAGLLFATLNALPASAETFKTPQALLNALYRYNTENSDGDAPSVYSAYFSDQLNKRFQADRDNTPDGDVGAIDFDPVIAGQDGQATNVKVGEPVVIDDTAEVEVMFRNGEPVTLFYSLVKERGGWKVDDIAKQDGEYPWSLSALFDDTQ